MIKEEIVKNQSMENLKTLPIMDLLVYGHVGRAVIDAINQLGNSVQIQVAHPPVQAVASIQQITGKGQYPRTAFHKAVSTKNLVKARLARAKKYKGVKMR